MNNKIEFDLKSKTKMHKILLSSGDIKYKISRKLSYFSSFAL